MIEFDLKPLESIFKKPFQTFLKKAILEGWDSIRIGNNETSVFKTYFYSRDLLGYHDNQFLRGQKLSSFDKIWDIKRLTQMSYECQSMSDTSKRIFFCRSCTKISDFFVGSCKPRAVGSCKPRVVGSCVCKKYQRNKKQEDILMQDILSRQWEFVATIVLPSDETISLWLLMLIQDILTSRELGQNRPQQ